MEIKRFDVDKGRTLIEWLISLDDPDSLDYHHRKTVTLDQIIREAKACLTEPTWQEKPRHAFLESSKYPGKCVNASDGTINTVCLKPADHPDHI